MKAFIWQNSRLLVEKSHFPTLYFLSNYATIHNMNKKYDIIAFEGSPTLIYKIDRDPLSLSLSLI